MRFDDVFRREMTTARGMQSRQLAHPWNAVYQCLIQSARGDHASILRVGVVGRLILQQSHGALG